MKHIIFIILTLTLLNSCLKKTENHKEESNVSTKVEKIRALEVNTELAKTDDTQSTNYSDFDGELNEIPPNGKYRFDIAFAEWEGKSMGEKVTIIIKGDSIKIVYEGDGQLNSTAKGEVIDKGKIMKHKSGEWIIGTKESDKSLDEIGGCTGGPAIISFKNERYWMC